MRILYDGAIYQEPDRGINRYFVNLISGLPDSFTPMLTTCAGRNRRYPRHPRLRLFRFPRFRPRRISIKLERLYFRNIQESRVFDIAHPTYYSLLSQTEMSDISRPIVLTVWDFIHEIFPELDPTGSVVEKKRRAIHAASAIICISENTRNDLLERYHLPAGKVRVIHLASDLKFSKRALQMNSSRPYFLFVGDRSGYKNFDGLLTAFAKVAAAENDVTLRVVGEPLSKTEQKLILEKGITQRLEFMGRVNDDRLSELYAGSVALVYPSFYEGFGIPLLEAMTCGTAIIAANRSSIPEVVGQAGLLFDPGRDELADAMLFLMHNPTARKALIAAGDERVRQFGWDKTIEETLRVYRDVAG